MPATAYPHIEVNSKGVPCIDGTRTRVVDIALARITQGWDAEEIQRHHPHFSLGQIYSALSYYYDHQAELDKNIEDARQSAEKLREELGDNPAAAKLRSLKRQREQPKSS